MEKVIKVVLIKVNYRKELLPHWQEIQQSVTELIYSFEAN